MQLEQNPELELQGDQGFCSSGRSILQINNFSKEQYKMEGFVGTEEANVTADFYFTLQNVCEFPLRKKKKNTLRNFSCM